jgi:hypothetical protein
MLLCRHIWYGAEACKINYGNKCEKMNLLRRLPIKRKRSWNSVDTGTLQSDWRRILT